MLAPEKISLSTTDIKLCRNVDWLKNHWINDTNSCEGRANGIGCGHGKSTKSGRKKPGIQMKGWVIQKSRGLCVNVNAVSSQPWPWKLGHRDILRQRASVPSWLRPTEDSPAGLRNSLLFRPQTDKWLGASVDWRSLDMLALEENHAGQVPRPKRPDPAGLPRS